MTSRRRSRRSRRRSRRSSTRSSSTGPERLSRFRDRIEEDRTANSKRFTEFKEAVGAEISGRRWFRNDGLVCAARRRGACSASRAGSCSSPGSSSFNSVAPTLERASSRSRSAPAGSSNAAVLVIAAFNRRLWRRRTPGRAGRGGALGGVPPLPDRLPPARHRPARDARALGALPRLRDRVRDRRARPAGRAAAHAGGARTGEHALLDRAARRPRLGPDLDGHRRPRVRASARRSRRRRPARAASAAASRAVAAAAAAEVAAAPGDVARRAARWLVAGCASGCGRRRGTTEAATGSTTAAARAAPASTRSRWGTARRRACASRLAGAGKRALVVVLHGAGRHSGRRARGVPRRLERSEGSC